MPVWEWMQAGDIFLGLSAVLFWVVLAAVVRRQAGLRQELRTLQREVNVLRQDVRTVETAVKGFVSRKL